MKNLSFFKLLLATLPLKREGTVRSAIKSEISQMSQKFNRRGKQPGNYERKVNKNHRDLCMI